VGFQVFGQRIQSGLDLGLKSDAVVPFYIVSL
jgi:hypothetical protein